MTKDTMEIRWHARGGQGAKTAATLVAAVALEEGKYGQGFPEYGPERMGAPIRGFTRISNKPIRQHSAVERPDVVVVLDPTLLESIDVCEGLADDGAVIVNTPASPAELRKKLKLPAKAKMYTIDAERISLDEIGRNIPNTPMMGALVKIAPIISLESINHDIEKKFGRKGERIVQGNIKAVKRAYEEVKSE